MQQTCKKRMIATMHRDSRFGDASGLTFRCGRSSPRRTSPGSGTERIAPVKTPTPSGFNHNSGVGLSSRYSHFSELLSLQDACRITRFRSRLATDSQHLSPKRCYVVSAPPSGTAESRPPPHPNPAAAAQGSPQDIRCPGPVSTTNCHLGTLVSAAQSCLSRPRRGIELRLKTV
jgi:hypothetical protein